MGLIPGQRSKNFTGDTVVNNLPANAGNTGDVGLIPELRRSLEEGNGNPLQYSCLENFMDRGSWQLHSTRSQRVGHNCAPPPPPHTAQPKSK